jgi:hypothetical protein
MLKKRLSDNLQSNPRALLTYCGDSFNSFEAVANSTSLDSPFEDTGSVLSSMASRATARRLRRTRQRLGSYRHDLVVAMRIVNSIEREVVQSEWENWLADENLRCDQLKIVIDGKLDKSKRGTAQKILAQDDGDGRKAVLRQWYDEYCGSCRTDQQAVMVERASMLKV